MALLAIWGIVLGSILPVSLRPGPAPGTADLGAFDPGSESEDPSFEATPASPLTTVAQARTPLGRPAPRPTGGPRDALGLELEDPPKA